MNNRSQDVIQTLVAFVLLVGVFLVTITDASAAPATSSVEDRVGAHSWYCEFTGGTVIDGGGWTVPGEELGTMVSTTVTICDYGDDGKTTCYDTPTTTNCTDSASTSPRDRGETGMPDDAVQDETSPSGPRVPPTTTPPSDTRD